MTFNLENLNKATTNNEQPHTAALQADSGWNRSDVHLVGGTGVAPGEPHGAGRTPSVQDTPVTTQTFTPTNNFNPNNRNTASSDSTSTSTSTSRSAATATDNTTINNTSGGGARVLYMPGIMQSAPSINAGLCQDGKSLGITAGWLSGVLGISGADTHPNTECLNMMQAQSRMAQACAQEVNRTQMTIALGDQELHAGRSRVATRAEFLANYTALGALRMGRACDSLAMGTPMPDIVRQDVIDQQALAAARPPEGAVVPPHPVHRVHVEHAKKKNCP